MGGRRDRGPRAAVGFTLLKFFASELLQSVSRNRFLASFGLIVGLLVWMNLLARLLLVAAAWSATVAADRGHLRTPDALAMVGVTARPGARRRSRWPSPVGAGTAGCSWSRGSRPAHSRAACWAVGARRSSQAARATTEGTARFIAGCGARCPVRGGGPRGGGQTSPALPPGSCRCCAAAP